MGKKGEGFTGTINYKGHMDDNKGGWKQGREVGRAGVVGRGGGEGRKLYLNKNKKILNKKTEKTIRCSIQFCRHPPQYGRFLKIRT